MFFVLTHLLPNHFKTYSNTFRKEKLIERQSFIGNGGHCKPLLTSLKWWKDCLCLEKITQRFKVTWQWSQWSPTLHCRHNKFSLVKRWRCWMVHHNAVSSIIYFTPIKLFQVLTVAGTVWTSGFIDMQNQNSKVEMALATAKHVQKEILKWSTTLFPQEKKVKVEKPQHPKKLSSRSFLSFLKVLFPPHTGSFSGDFRFSCFMVHGYLHRTCNKF